MIAICLLVFTPEHIIEMATIFIHAFLAAQHDVFHDDLACRPRKSPTLRIYGNEEAWRLLADAWRSPKRHLPLI